MNAFPLKDGPIADDFYPFSLTRSLADIRVGILTIREKWEILSRYVPSFPENISIPSNIIPNQNLLQQLWKETDLESCFKSAVHLLNLTDILGYNRQEIKNDFHLLTNGRHSAPVSDTNKLIGSEIFLEPGAIVEHCYLNSMEGPIYIGKDALIMEGSMIRGPFSIGEKGIVKMGAKIYGASSIGPHCVVGGEIKNSVFFGFSNKSHDGYLGDSVIGEWCNIGGGSSNSNIKNSLGPVKLWNPVKKSFLDAGIKCGLMMGDYSRSAINTSFTTGAVIGVSSHVFGNGLTPAYLPSFSWGFDNEQYRFDKAIEHIRRWKKLKGHELENKETEQLKFIFDQQNNE